MTRRQALARTVGFALLIPFVLTMPYAMGWAGPAYAVDYGVIIAMVVLSISVLGWIGEFSLAPVAQMGFGLVVVNFLQSAEVPFAFIMPIVAIASIPISLILGAFALRLRGVYFAIATLAFAYMAQKTFFQSYLGVQGGFGGGDSKTISRPGLFADDTAFYYLLMGSLLLLAWICRGINRSWVGTSLTALRESEMALSCLGHSPGAYKMFAICLSGAIAFVAGGYFGMLQGLVPANYFNPGLAILYFGFAAAGGLGSVGGAVAAGLVFGALPRYFDTISEGRFVAYDQFFIGVLVVLIVLKVPGGLAEVGRRLWRRIEGPPKAPEVVIPEPAAVSAGDGTPSEIDVLEHA